MEYLKLEDCCEILDSKRIPVTANKRRNGKYPYYGANGLQDYVDDYIFDDELVLLAEDGGNFNSKDKPIAYRVSGKCWVNNHAHVLKPKQGISVDYLCYALMYYDVSGLVNGATRQKLTQATMRKMKIPILSEIDQLRIVEIMNSIQELKNDYRSILHKLDVLIKARFIEMFGRPFINNLNWESKQIKNVVNEVKYGTSKPSVENGEYKYLRMNNLTYDGRFDLTDLKFISLNNDELEKCVVRKGDVLFNRTNSLDLIGKTAEFDFNEDMVIAGYIIRIRLKETIVPKFFSMYMNTDEMKLHLRTIAKGAVNQANINAQELQEIPIYLPPIELQNQFVNFVRQVDKSREEVKKSLEKTQQLYDSLMQEYFG